MSSMAQLGLSEGWLRHEIAAHPNKLNLGAYYTPQQEVVQEGRVDLLLTAPSGERLVVEIQRGSADLSHVSRLLRYWAFEEEKSPGSNTAVLIAESYPEKIAAIFDVLTPRLPLKAITVEVARNDGSLVVSFTERVPARVSAPPRTLPQAPSAAEALIRERPWFRAIERLFEPVAELNPACGLAFRTGYVAAQRNGGTFNFFAAHDGRSGCLLELKVPYDEETERDLRDSGLPVGSYVEGSEARRHFPVGISNDVEEEQLDVIQPYFLRAYDLWRSRAERQA